MSIKQALATVISLALLVGASTLAIGSAPQSQQEFQVESQQEFQVETVPGSVDPLCTDEDGPIQTLTQLRQSKIEIEIPKSRSWASNIVAAITTRGTTILDEFKKNFKARIYVTSPAGATCIFKGTIRISGDWRDHLSFANGTPTASIDVKLEKGNLAGVVRFKLLLPETRGGDNEIVQAALMREMDILSPRTSYLNVTVNGFPVEYIFQENIEKELLESQFRREAPLFESDESMFWDDRRDDQISEDQRIITPKMTNSSWIGESQNRAAIAKRGLDVLYSAYASYWETRYLDPQLIANNDSVYLQKNYEFLALMLAGNAEHGLIPHNRRFFFNPMKNGLEPVYYDGGSQTLNLDREVLPATYAAQQGAASALARLANLNSTEFATLLNSYGVEISDADVAAMLVDLRHRLESYAASDLPETGAPTWKANNFADLNSANRSLIFAKDPNNAIECDFELVVCSDNELSDKEYQALIAGKLVKDEVRFIYAGGLIENYTKGLEPAQDDMSEAQTYSLSSGEEFIVTGSANVEISEPNRTISVLVRSAGSRLYMANANLSDWLIIYNSVPGLVAPNTEDRFDDRLLTGCVNIVDSTLINVNFDITSALCEDGLNLVRVTGNIPELKINGTVEDGLDMDFSYVSIEQLYVSNTGNDCLDLSSGSYLVTRTELSSCGDKGISVGEMAKSDFKEISIDGAVIGLAVKDWAIFYAETLELRNVETCVSAYRKKQEFGRAVISISATTCTDESFVIQDYSEFTDAR